MTTEKSLIKIMANGILIAVIAYMMVGVYFIKDYGKEFLILYLKLSKNVARTSKNVDRCRLNPR